MDRLDSMRIFMRVVELGSFAAVARQMNVARSLITRQVAALEAQLGVKLIACRMAMDVMGIKDEELIDGVVYGGVATYLGDAIESKITLFI